MDSYRKIKVGQLDIGHYEVIKHVTPRKQGGIYWLLKRLTSQGRGVGRQQLDEFGRKVSTIVTYIDVRAVLSNKLAVAHACLRSRHVVSSYWVVFFY